MIGFLSGLLKSLRGQQAIIVVNGVGYTVSVPASQTPAIGKNIDILTEVETKRPFGFEKLSPAKAVQIYHLLELTESLTETHQKNITIFSLLINFLKTLSRTLFVNSFRPSAFPALK